MRLILSTLCISICWILALLLWWRPGQSLIELTRPDWPAMYEKAYTPNMERYSLTGAMSEFIRSEQPYRSLALFIQETMGGNVVRKKTESVRELSGYLDQRQDTVGPQYLSEASALTSDLQDDRGYLQIETGSERIILHYNHLAPDELSGKSIPSQLRYPGRTAAMGAAGLALLLTIIAVAGVGAGDKRVARSTAGKGCRVFIALGCAGVGLVVMPFYYGWYNDFPPFVFVGGFIIICGLIGFTMFGWLALVVGRLLSGSKALVHWTYDHAEWQRYVTWAYGEDVREKRQLFLLVAGITLLIGGVFWLLMRDRAAALVFCFLVGLLLFIWLLITVLPWLTRRRDQQQPGEIVAGKNAIYHNGSVHCWTFPGSRLEGVARVEQPFPMVQIRYSYLMMAGRTLYFFRNYVTVSLPIPAGREEEAARLVEALSNTAT